MFLQSMCYVNGMLLTESILVEYNFLPSVATKSFISLFSNLYSVLLRDLITDRRPSNITLSMETII